MTKGVRVNAGYRRAAAGMVGCLLMGGALGTNPLHLEKGVPVTSGENPSAASHTVLTWAPARESDLQTAADRSVPDVHAVVRQRLLADENTGYAVQAYTVREGDTIWTVANEYNTDADTLMDLNADVDPELLQPGQTLRVAQAFHGITYTVRAGDTLLSIAQDFAISAAAIREANAMGRDGAVTEGELLFLPGARPRGSRPLLASRSGWRREAPPASVEPEPEPESEPEEEVEVAPEPVEKPSTEPAPAPAPEPAPVAPAPAGDGWLWPVTGGLFTAEFGEPRDYGIHEGLDIAVPYGTPAVASRSGTVVFAGWDGGYGYCVIIDHGDGFRTRYAHASAILVSAGEHVAQGDPVVRVGSTGNSTGNHLHFEVIHGGSPVDPRAYLP